MNGYVDYVEIIMLIAMLCSLVVTFAVISLRFGYRWAMYKVFEQRSHTVWNNPYEMCNFERLIEIVLVILLVVFGFNIPSNSFDKFELLAMLTMQVPIQCLCMLQFRKLQMAKAWKSFSEIPWKKLFLAYGFAILAFFNYVFIFWNICRK